MSDRQSIRPVVHVVTPTRGDRPPIFACLNQLYAAWQDYPVAAHWRIAYQPRTDRPDLVTRVRLGLERAFDRGANLVLVMEDDDYYAPGYAREMVGEWERAGRPSALVSIDGARYHLATRNWGHIREEKRRPALFMSGFSQMPDTWPAEDDLFLDARLPSMVPDLHQFVLPAWQAIGIKHGLGLCGGNQHWLMARKEWSGVSDSDGSVLREVIGEDLARVYLRLGNAIRDGAYGTQAEHRVRLQAC